MEGQEGQQNRDQLGTRGVWLTPSPLMYPYLFITLHKQVFTVFPGIASW